MDRQKAGYVKIRLRLAREKLRVARLLHENREYRDAISRAYYTLYYAAKAFLLFHGQDPYSHKGVSVLFHKFCATHKQPATRFAQMFSILQAARLDADYKEKVRISRQDSQEAIDMAGLFLKEIETVLKHKTSQ